MIFYGTNSSRLKNGRVNNVVCPNCSGQTSMNYSVFGRYAYLYWIPVFPVGKVNVLECNSCKRTFKLEELTDDIKKKFEREKHKGIPILHFSGSFVIIAIIALIIYSTSQDKKNEAIYIQEPQIGDVYSIEGSQSGFYTTMKVVKVIGDSTYVAFNDYEVDRKYSTSQIDKMSNYNDEEVEVIATKDLIDLYEDEVIYEIKR